MFVLRHHVAEFSSNKFLSTSSIISYTYILLGWSTSKHPNYASSAPIFSYNAFNPIRFSKIDPVCSQ
ncbi:uncharacterized protein MELLADRAFT_90374 [Melampsora larici-populina 98AG31]|uniref:Uncharacterized protein n=1 Tax=Melampsora larici-populina (strain 98AG31 / pathotype 3-4-7) TaxID=747676 RepID=F4RWP2_MELLP|nr:uncharacterized protein MELLADRAFT_90374 [Melampsora larici-populina 98AG31]EGG03195.1 hypothetical protein MELLADRAFT_90374 [Melampsora larici-populina 98AG31]